MDFIRHAENQFNHKVKTSDNGTEFKNNELIELCGLKGIKREYSNARTPQQNGVAERKNMTLIEAARTILENSFLPTTFWAEVVNTACYVLNRVLVTKPQNKTPYKLLTGRQLIISYLRPFGFHVTILNTIDQLGKFDGNSDLGFLVRYSLNSKALGTPISTAGPSRALNDGETSYYDDPSMPHLEDIYASPSEGIFTNSSYDDESVVTDFNNLETTMNVSRTPTTRIHTIHPKTQILGDPLSAVQTRSKVNKNSEARALFKLRFCWSYRSSSCCLCFRVFLLEDLEVVFAGYDIVPAGHVLVSADRYRIC
nr:ribonuclease H-like domain-containing protein [Tanacetum cinerariifolium]